MIDCTNVEAETISQIERLTFLIRQARRRIEHARTQGDRRAINSQIEEMLGQIELLRRRLK